MNNFLLLQNIGEVPVEAFSLIGASTKRDDNTKIGFFGSGLKYSIPVLLREGIDFKVFTGEQEIKFETRKHSMKGHEFDVVLINGRETSLTMQMGPKWVLWFAIRELYSNMLDESEGVMSEVAAIEPTAGQTRIYLDLNNAKLKTIYENFGQYFSAYRKDVIYCNSDGDSILGSSELGAFYRRGIRCYDEKKTSVFDYDFTSVEIDENRVCTYGGLLWNVAQVWLKCTDSKLILQYLESLQDKESIEFEASNYMRYYMSYLNEKSWSKALEGKRLIPQEFSGYVEDLNPLNDVLIPKALYQQIKPKLDCIQGVGFDATMPYKDITTTPYQDAMLKRTLKWFEECISPISYPIKVVSFFDETVYGLAKEGTIFICQKCFIKGKDFLAATILEEQMHLQYRVKDESRPFQNLLLEHCISYMSQINANPL